MFITAFYAFLLVLMQVTLALWVIAGRMLRVSPEALHQRQRVHGNLAENAPLFLIAFALADFHQGNPVALHVIGSLFVLARLAHGYGLSMSMGRSAPRFIGTVMTFNTMGAAAGYALWLAYST